MSERVAAAGIIAVLRRIPEECLPSVIEALALGGVRMCEITWDDDRAPRLLEKALEISSADFLWGMGTVTAVKQARRAVETGACFIVSPVFVPEVVHACLDMGVTSIPGAFSPSEVHAAWKTGGDLIKVFPACVLGPRYFHELQGPMPGIPLVAVGGVDVSNAAAFLQAGARAVAAGGKLIPQDAVRQGQWERITDTARRFVAAVREGKALACSGEG
ncbi:MAG: bifunctional 4-hydroxy-2-oxoglutarate aldolase/2-dehydro-3-deoxy-phosphogluconate aldolase [Bacillota bacterium]|nr:bifunctional 4-hydroxy-2-oxoglutarate aldolase/2-dehydro-3-deoxy-phosphogluconate aldolase [Bacillota bacterium]